jgi:radical SAM protein with 4Fe4S-binding SPASM domain
MINPYDIFKNLIVRHSLGARGTKNFPDLPIEVMIEIEPRCNFYCAFCFNKISFAKQGRQKIKFFSTGYVKKIIKQIKKAGIQNVRFTGGEPLLRPDILEILKYAKDSGFKEVRLNTNGSLIDKKLAVRLVEYVDNFLLPLESFTAEKEAQISGFKNSFVLKLEALHWLELAGAKTIRLGTVVTKRAIGDLEQIAAIVAQQPVSRWELYRPIPMGDEQFLIDTNDAEILVEKLSALANKFAGKQSYYIANALPFCSVKNPDRMNHFSGWGAFLDGGYTRFVIDPRGFAKPHYFSDENIGDPLNPLACWSHPFMQKMRNLEFLPDKCTACQFKNKCRGGSRFAAKTIFGDYRAPDPLANFSNTAHR